MSVWSEVVGQPDAVSVLQRAAADDAAMTHAWLFTGPPGSGRSIAARAFAAALQCEQRTGCGECKQCRTTVSGTHADVDLVATEGLSLKVSAVRELVATAALRPQVGRWRIIVIEDADRLNDHSANALLKSLEEPESRTVWLLCAPSPEDVIITIRSRARHVGLRTPPARAVADLLVARDGVDLPMALYAAHAAQSHVGIARRLATREDARRRRHEVVTMAGRNRSLGESLTLAANLVDVAQEEADQASGDREVQERERLLAQLGAEAGARTQPPHVRSQLKTLEDEQKDRRKRYARDVLDRSLVDLQSMFRDALLIATGAGGDLVNASEEGQVAELARSRTPERLLGDIEAIGLTRERINLNAAPLLAVEAMMIALQSDRKDHR